MKKLLTTLALLTVIGTPAFAQYAPQDYQDHQAPVRQTVQHKKVVGQNGRSAFAAVPGASAASGSLDDPSLTGGGSVGYNQLVRTPW